MIKKLLIVLGPLAVGVMALLTFAQHTVVDLDLWGSIAMGRETLLRGWPPTQDPFAYVPTLTSARWAAIWRLTSGYYRFE